VVAALSAVTDPGTATTNFWVTAGIVAGLGVGVAAVVLPLRLGIRSLRAMEF
jgi:hypothetical protein